MLNLMVILASIIFILSTLNLMISIYRGSAIKSPYYNTNKVGNCKRNKKNKPLSRHTKA